MFESTAGLLEELLHRHTPQKKEDETEGKEAVAAATAASRPTKHVMAPSIPRLTVNMNDDEEEPGRLPVKERPFDEELAATVVGSSTVTAKTFDEKKEADHYDEEEDEIMSRRILSKSSLDMNNEDEDSQPPSLAAEPTIQYSAQGPELEDDVGDIVISSSLSNAIRHVEKEEHFKQNASLLATPPVILRTSQQRKQQMIDSIQNAEEAQDLNEEHVGAVTVNLKHRTEQQSDLRHHGETTVDILAVDQNHALMTPDQQLKSPPTLIKKTRLDWNLPSPSDGGEGDAAQEEVSTEVSDHFLHPKVEDLPMDEESQVQPEKQRTTAENDDQANIEIVSIVDDGASKDQPEASDVIVHMQEEETMQEEGIVDKLLSILRPPTAKRSISEPVHVTKLPDKPNIDTSDDEKIGEPGNLVGDKPDIAVRSISDVAKSSSSSSDWSKYLVSTNKVNGVQSSRSGNDLASQWVDRGETNHTAASEDRPRPSYREMTPKKDLKSSEKSAAWLQEEFKRRSIIKEEINAAILARSDLRERDTEFVVEAASSASDRDATTSDDLERRREKNPPDATSAHAAERMERKPSDNAEEVFAAALSHALQSLPVSPIRSDSVAADVSQNSEDDEVAALTTFAHPESSKIQATPSDEDTTPLPRRLEYGSAPSSDKISPSRGADSDANLQKSKATEVLNDTRHVANEARDVSDSTQTHTMQPGKESSTSQFRSLAVSKSMVEAENASVEVTALFTDTSRFPGISALPDDASDHSQFDLTKTPLLVDSMDSHIGVAKGDICLSLLNEDSGAAAKSTWASRVRVALWRARGMRRAFGGTQPLSNNRPPGSPARGRTSLPVDLDMARVAGGVRTVQATQEAAHRHLKHDEFDEAIELFEDIIFAYYGYFDHSLSSREANPGGDNNGITDFQPYIAVAHHNLGILNLLKGEYAQALTRFRRAADNRRSCLGEGHNDHVVSVVLLTFGLWTRVGSQHCVLSKHQASLVKLATCHYALNEFADAHKRFEEALAYSRKEASPHVEDQMQTAEILNNLGCLAYMCGQPSSAVVYFRESMDVQFALMNKALYLCSASDGRSISLNLSITRANIGFVKLVTGESSVAVTALENALMVS